MRWWHHSVLRYGVVGLSNTALGLLVILVALRLLHWSDELANALGFIVGFAWSYLLNRSWTFGHRGAPLSSLGRFLGVCACGYVLNLVVLVVLTHQFGAGHFAPQVLAVVAYSGFVYLGSRYFAFPSSAPR